MPVITPDGLVGKVLNVYGETSQVLMINDLTSGVGAILVKSRLQGIVKGTPTGELQLNYIMSDESVQPGEPLVTSGGDRVFPKGLPIGTVSSVSVGHNLFLDIKVKPGADLNRLEEVLVITEQKARAPEATGQEAVRASDILAGHLPGVPVAAPAAAQPASPGSPAAPKPAGSAAPKPAGLQRPSLPGRCAQACRVCRAQACWGCCAQACRAAAPKPPGLRPSLRLLRPSLPGLRAQAWLCSSLPSAAPKPAGAAAPKPAGLLRQACRMLHRSLRLRLAIIRSPSLPRRPTDSVSGAEHTKPKPAANEGTPSQ